jgi:hypothetical protein
MDILMFTGAPSSRILLENRKNSPYLFELTFGVQGQVILK